MQITKNRIPFIAYLLVLLVFCAVLSLIIGPQKLSAIKIPQLLFMPDNSADSSVLWMLKIPRLLTAFAVGALIALSGILFQGLTRDPIKETYISAFTNKITLILMIIGAIGLIITGNAAMLTSWLFGSFNNVSWGTFIWAFSALVIVCSIVFLFSRDMDALLHGDDTAVTLGVTTGPVRMFLSIVSIAIVLFLLPISGIIPIVGIVASSLVRENFGARYRYLLTSSILTGAIIVCLMDIFSRIIAGGNIPLSVIAVVAGLPVYSYLIVRRRFFK